MLKTLSIGFFATLLTALAYGPSFGQQKQMDLRWKDYISLNNYLKPFWRADTVYDEIVLMIKDGKYTTGSLLFDAAKIVSVRATDLSVNYKKGDDWIYRDRKLSLSLKSKVPFIKKEDLVFETEKPGWSMAGKVKGTYVLFSEGHYFPSMQIAVTYIPVKKRTWSGTLPIYDDKALPLSIKKLQNKQPLKIVFYGNSIETGASASAFINRAPYMPGWPELIVHNLQQTYGTKVDFSNLSVGGMLAQWGADKAAELVVPQNPDLVIIGFGMNDGTFSISPEKFRNNIESIMDPVRAQNSKAEFILIAPMLANPYATQNGLQELYKAELDKLARNGVVVADITSLHRYLLQKKSYQDMTGNNVNHPNDYLARWYAQFLSAFLIK